MSVFLIAILLGLTTGDFVVAEEAVPKQTDDATLAVQAVQEERALAQNVLEWHGAMEK
ncbi:hypothetical protein [Tumebacillus algifaecis]|uniref:hypothetical protein n=1 Tax=Tumebacillus algifaecis TaxID=1214604 RepID=UPI0012FDF4C7|nr:hypothetical protein [Tumebacillus algifaecis]